MKYIEDVLEIIHDLSKKKIKQIAKGDIINRETAYFIPGNSPTIVPEEYALPLVINFKMRKKPDKQIERLITHSYIWEHRIKDIERSKVKDLKDRHYVLFHIYIPSNPRLYKFIKMAKEYAEWIVETGKSPSSPEAILKISLEEYKPKRIYANIFSNEKLTVLQIWTKFKNINKQLKDTEAYRFLEQFLKVYNYMYDEVNRTEHNSKDYFF